MSEPIKGLPDGVELVKIGVATADDYELINEVDPKTGQGIARIYHGVRPGASSGIIVKPAEGWSFRADIRTMSFVPVKMFAQPLTISATAKFAVDSDYDEQTVKQALEKLKALPGFVELS